LAWLHSPILLPTPENNNNNYNSSNNNNSNRNSSQVSKAAKSSEKFAEDKVTVVPSEQGEVVGRIQGPSFDHQDLVQGPNNREEEEEERGGAEAAECYLGDFNDSAEADKNKGSSLL
jgi:hypothetical protein